MARRFVAAGHRVVASLAEADLHVVNSCTVTAEAARGSRQAARRGGRLSNVRTVLLGCYAAAEPAAAARLAGVDLVLGNLEKDGVVERVHAAFPEAVPEAVPCAFPEAAPAFHTRALVKIEDGCDVRCA